MKAALLLLLLSFAVPITGLTQDTALRAIPFRYLMVQTIDMMRQLDIRTRKAVEQDSPFITYRILPNAGRIVAYFSAAETCFLNDTATRYRYYINPMLVLSRSVDSILRYSADTTTIQYIQAESVIIHELTHYLQGVYDTPLPFTIAEVPYTEYMKRPSELEAFGTAACFFTRKYNPDKFAQIAGSGKTLQGKKADLIMYLFRTTAYKLSWERGAK